jgi:hypothetical protein
MAYRWSIAGVVGAAVLLCAMAGGATAQELRLGAPYVCAGQHLFVENYNIRDTSDAASCMVGHPDHVGSNG